MNIKNICSIFTQGLDGSNYLLKAEVQTVAPPLSLDTTNLNIMKNQEIWKDIKGYEGYYKVSNLGRVKSLNRKVRSKSNSHRNVKERILRQTFDGGQYLIVGLHNGKQNIKKVHRLVAQAFIPNPENKRTINHKNGIKSDNGISNLEWMTYSENHLHSFRELGRKSGTFGKLGMDNSNSKHVIQKNKDGQTINNFGSQLEAQRKTGISHKCISLACLGKHKTAGNYIWEFWTDK